MVTRWLKMQDSCSSCGDRFDRHEHDYFIGAYTLNLIVSELIVVGLMVAVMLITWPDVPWTVMTWSIVALMIPAPVLLYPYSKSVWLALDLSFQPPLPSEYRDGEPPVAAV